MIQNKFFEGKRPAQAMVEFAIALPVLLLLLYGILEAGRLLFLYSTVVTASRQAARYGSATGVNADNVPHYWDCAGIRAAANAVGYLGKFDLITLSYDQGVSGNPPARINPTPYCNDPNNHTDSSSLSTTTLGSNRTRLVVTVSTAFHPLVKLVPFLDRTITATSARTILYSVPIVVEQEQQEWYKVPTVTLITSDNPDPSEIEGYVTVTVEVKNMGGTAGAPTGVVHITGADQNCDINLPQTSCDVRFDTAGSKVLTAFYEGDTDHLASSDTEDHEVTIWHTTLTFLSDLPDPSVKGDPFTVVVQVTGGNVTPTGTVDLDGGNGVRCSIPLDRGAGNCTLSYNNLGRKTLSATYNGDSLHLPSGPVNEPHEVVEGTPTPTMTPTATKIPTATLIPTLTSTPTLTPSPTMTLTPVSSCDQVTHGSISLAGGVMSMTISNPYPFPLVMKDVTVTWNSDKGHNQGNKQLFLQKVTLDTATIWTGNVSRQDTYTIPTTATLPESSTTTITFYFHQTYDNMDGTERIYINLTTPGCENYPINSQKP